jgi:hypothetical protein
MARRAVVITLVVVLAACSGENSSTAATPIDAALALPIAKSSVRCSECHSKIASDWKGSAHARAATSPAYLAMRGDDASCDRCHAPLTPYVEAGLPVIREGVTCEACHAIPEVTVSPTEGMATWTMKIADNVKFGPLCDATGHYFHRSKCLPLFSESRYCASCHHWSAGALPIFTEYAEWTASRVDADCQDCHMPGDRHEVARGFNERGVPHHGFRGKEGELRRRALTAQLTVSLEGESLRVAVELKNARAGHHVPAGLPGRQLVLRARVVDAQGKELAAQERVYARVLVDDTGAEVPFPKATKEGSDTRLAAGETRTETLELRPAAGTHVEVELKWRALSPALSQILKVATDDERLAQARLPLDKLPVRQPLLEEQR